MGARIPDVNNVMVAGRLGREPELKYTASNKAYCKFGVCYTRRWRDAQGGKQEDTSWFEVITWDKTAEYAAELPKGAAVLVEGALRQDTWTTADGDKRSSVTINARRVHALEWPDDQPGSETASRPAAQAKSPRSTYEPEDLNDNDDIPF